MKRISSPFKFTIICVINVLFLFFSHYTVSGKNYYFSTSGGDDTRTSTQAQSTATPWKTITKLNTFFISLAAGDSILFKKGEVFFGTITVTKSGTLTLPIVLGSYGTGVKPIISGFTVISGWTDEGNGIFSKSLTFESIPNVVAVNNVNTPLGRYPNTGWLTYESHSGVNIVTDNELTGTPNWTGAEIAIRKRRWAFDRGPITNHSSNTLTFTAQTANVPIDKFGYFIQNDIKTLDLLGEWCIVGTTFKIKSATTPSNVQVSTLDNLLNINGYNYITISNLTFRGANRAAIGIGKSNNIIIKNSEFDFTGKYAINIEASSYITLDYLNINHSNDMGVYIGYNSPFVTLSHSIIKNTGMLVGMGLDLRAVVSYSANTTIQYNEIDSTGYNGISFDNNNATISNNLVNYFCMIKDDGAGIYTYIGSASTVYTNRKVANNIVLNGIGINDGTDGLDPFLVEGIYSDGYTKNVDIVDNTVANCADGGIYLNCNDGGKFENNTSFNNRNQIELNNWVGTPNPLRNLKIKKNIFFSRTATQRSLIMRNKDSDYTLFGIADSNYYCRPIDDNSSIYTYTTGDSWNGVPRTLAQWKTLTAGKDLNSHTSPQTITSTNDILFDYNPTNNNKIISLNGTYIDVAGNVFTGSITIKPYSSVVLIKSANSTNQSPSIQNQSFKLNENSPNGTIVGTVLASDPNVGQSLTYSILSGNINGAFSINAATGVLSVVNLLALNFEATPVFSLIVSVQDNGTVSLKSQATITVTLQDLNEPPVINAQSFSVIVNSPNGTTLGTVLYSDPDAGQTETFSILSGNTNSAFIINSTSGILSVANSVAINNIGNIFTLVVRVQDNGLGNLNSQATITVTLLNSNIICSATGNITYQRWNSITGATVTSLTSNVNYPNSPSVFSSLTSMEAPSNVADNFGARIVGYICAPITGSYTFWIAADDQCELWLSTDDQPANKQKIAYHTGYTDPRSWNVYSTQKSGIINLVQGHSYYVEALMKEGASSDNLAVGWLKPGQTGTVPSEVVPGTVLSPLGTVSPIILVSSVTLSSTTSINIASTILLTTSVLPNNATNSTLTWATSNSAIATVSNNGLITGVAAGTAIITATSTDGSNKSGTTSVTVNPIVCSATGIITYQIWNNITGATVSSLTSNINYPNSPSSTSTLSSMEAPSKVADNFGARIVGYICAPITGSYTFWIAADDQCELWLSTDDQSANKQKIAFHNGYTDPRSWNIYATQKSATISLLQGRSYYVEAIMKEGIASDNLAVGWLKPGQTGSVPSEVIPGTVLSPIVIKSKEALPETNQVNDFDVKLLVYPNPLGNEVLNIKLENVISEATINIYSVAGILCYIEKIPNSTNIQIDRNIFKSGVYFIKVYNDQFIKTKKIIIK